MSWTSFEYAINALSDALRPLVESKQLYAIHGIPRGGLPIAVSLSHRLNLPLGEGSLIVDDIADSGRTLLPYKGHVIATWFYHKQSLVVPTIWIEEKTNAWIVFPWENI